jgi:hypothetical protein
MDLTPVADWMTPGARSPVFRLDLPSVWTGVVVVMDVPLPVGRFVRSGVERSHLRHMVSLRYGMDSTILKPRLSAGAQAAYFEGLGGLRLCAAL